jgi:nucleotide-binding universal stress UspA family protein
LGSQKTPQILVAIDINTFSDKGLKAAIKYAKFMNAEITGVNVVEVRATLASTVINYKKFFGYC